MFSESTHDRSFRKKLRNRFDRLRSRSRHVPSDSALPPPEIHLNPNIAVSPHVSGQASLATVSCSGTSETPEETQATQRSHQPSVTNSDSVSDAHVSNSADVMITSTDLWSAAFREAINTLEPKMDVACITGKTVEQLFDNLRGIENSATEDSMFRRGLEHLRSAKGPLENFKVALDLANPLIAFEPTAATVFGIVRSVTAVAISLASADLEFANTIGDMLEQMSYIDDCDTLGQKSDSEQIHKALVLVYQKFLEFYKVALEVLNDSGAKMILRIMLNNVRLPEIVGDFLKRSGALNKLVVNATQEILLEIKTMLYDQEISRWLGSEKLFRQNQRYLDLRALYADETCEFLLDDPSFSRWCCQPDCRQLVIFGEMGCGKSVASAFLVHELRQISERQLPKAKVCYYYCQDDGSGRALQVFSTLILQLLKQFAGLVKAFHKWYKEKQASGNFEPAADTATLATFLEHILGSIDRPIFIVIDGLDECDRVSRKQILRLLDNVSRKSSRIKAVLLSRPTEEITEQLNKAAVIYFDPETKRDAIIASHMVESQLSHLPMRAKYLITEVVSRRAQGSAIWTRMMIELIQIRGHRALGPINDLLEDASALKDLFSLYNTLLLQRSSGNLDNFDLASTALRLLAVARRPLSIIELAWIVAMEMAPPKVTTITALSRLVDHHRIFEFIHPFINRVDFADLKKRQVGLVHQSVREFLQIHHASRVQSRLCFSSEEKTGDKMFSSSPCTELLEASMLNVCLRYLALDDIGQNQLFSEHQLAIDELPQDTDLFDEPTEPTNYDPNCSWEEWESNMIQYDPAERGFGEFFVYASCHWIEHYRKIDTVSLVSLESIEKICESGSTRLNNWIEQNRRPGCAVKPRFEFDSSLYDPLGITSLYGSEAMLASLLRSADFDQKQYLPNSAVAAADQVQRWGEPTRLRLLYESRLGHQLRDHSASNLQ